MPFIVPAVVVNWSVPPLKFTYTCWLESAMLDWLDWNCCTFVIAEPLKKAGAVTN